MGDGCRKEVRALKIKKVDDKPKSTDYQNLESAKEFSDKCVDAAANWTPVADRLWMASKGAACAGCHGYRQ